MREPVLVIRVLLCATLFALGCGSSPSETATCAAGQSMCTGGCVDTSRDPANCGACDNACPAAPGGGVIACVDSQCMGSCGSPYTLCGSTCADLMVDPANCGTCSHACPAAPDGGASSCVNGTCAGECPSPFTQCGGSCTDLTKDPANCGSCGTACPSGFPCFDGHCISPGLTLCPGPGGTAKQVDLAHDVSNCGGCARACQAGEQCLGGRCYACPSLRCGGVCVDAASDPKNCGGCGTACAGSNACLDGVCGAPMSITILPPSSGGSVPSGAYMQTIRVTSRYTTQSVRVQIGTGATLFMSLVSSSGVDSIWAASITVGAAGTMATLHFTAQDPLFVSGSASAALHSASAQVDVTALAVPTGTPTLTLVDNGGATVPAGAYVPLNAPALTLEATMLPAGAAQVRFHSNLTPVLGTASVAGGMASFTGLPPELGLGTATLSACVVDAAGQEEAPGNCATYGPILIGRVPLNGPAPVTLSKSASGSALFYLGPPTGTLSQLFGVSSTQISPAGLPSTPVVGTQYVGNNAHALVPTETTTGVLAVRGDGSGIDRFDCLGGGACNTIGYVTAAPTVVGQIDATTGKTVLMSGGSTGAFQVAFPPGTPAVIAAGGFPTSGPLPQTTASGAIVFWTQNTLTAPTSYQLKLAHPATTVINVGLPASTAPGSLLVLPGGEIIWSFDNAGKRFVQAALFDGVALTTTTPLLVNPSTVPSQIVLVKPKLVVGLANDVTGNVSSLFEADLTQPKISFPIAPNPAVGPPLKMALRGGGTGPFSISDDQMKVALVTSDPVGTGIQRTLRLIDLASGFASVVYSSGSLDQSTTPSPTGPFFAHSAAGARVSGGAPSGQLAPVPALVYADAISGSSPRTVRLGYALYRVDASAPSPVTVDPPAWISTSSAPVASAAGGNLLFTADDGGTLGLYSVPLNPVVSGSATAQRVLAPTNGQFVVDEDTGQLLAEDIQGTLYYAKLKSGSSINLTPIADGGAWMEGGGVPQFGFTPDGHHAWFAQVTDPSGLATFGIVEGSLEVIDLDTGARTGLGAIGLSGFFTPAFFFDNAQFFVSYLPPTDHTVPTLPIFAASVATPSMRTVSLQAVDTFGNGSVTTGLDGGEGLFAMTAGPPARFAISPTMSYGGSSLLSVQTVLFNQPSTYTPPTNDASILQVASGLSFYQLWQQGMGPSTFAPNFTPAFGATRRTSTNDATLFGFTNPGDAAGAYAIEEPGSGHALQRPYLP